MTNEAIFIVLFMIATAVAIGVRRLRIPYTVALVLAGLILGLVHAFRPPHLTKELLFTVFLPGLLFEAAFHIDFQEFWRNKMAIISLAVPGVIAAMSLTTLILTPVANSLDFISIFSWHYALVFGALIAATDPIAVVAMFKSLGAPRRLRILVDGESLLNDGTGIVFFTLSLSLVSGGKVSAPGLFLDFILIVGIGILVGAGIGLAVSQIIRHVDDPMIEITLTTIAAYGAFMVAEQLHYSGVIATVTAGLFAGNYAARTGMSPSTRIAVETFWEYMAFALNSIVFLLIGFEAKIPHLLASWKIVIVAFLAVTIGRGIVILGMSGILRRTREHIPWPWSAVMTWGGLRGALPMVLVLSLPDNFAHRDLLVSMTFGVVIISILLNGLTISPLLRKLGIVKSQRTREEYEMIRGKLQAQNAALEFLDNMSAARLKNTDIINTLRQDYEEKIEKNESRISEMHINQEQLHDEELEWARRQLLLAEKNEVLEAFHRGVLSQEIYDRLLADIDARLLELDTSRDTERNSDEEDKK
ncbi:MAG: Na+/H+ antiporter [Calditrichia bacterium]